MDNVELVWSNADAEVHRFVVGPVDNNVYVVRCRRTGVATLIDAANEHDRLLRVGARAWASPRSSRPTATGTTSARSSRCATPASTCGCATRTPAMLPGYDHLLDDDDVLAVSATCACARCTRRATRRAPSPSPSRTRPCCSPATPSFPGGPGNTTFEGGDFATIITSIEERIFAVLRRRHDHLARPRRPSTIGAERPHLDEWVARGW